MAGQNAEFLKNFFQTEDIPTEQQFADLIDSLYEKDDNVLPKTDNTFDLGSSSKRFKDIFASGEITSLKNKTGLTYYTSITTPDSQAETYIDLSANNIQKVVVSSDTVLYFQNRKIGVFTIIIVQDEIGRRVIFDEDHIFTNGTVQQVANQIDLINIFCDGSNIYANVINNFS